MNELLDPFPVAVARADEADAVLGHGAGELRAQDLAVELQRPRIAGEEEVQPHAPLAGEHAVDLEEHPVRGDVHAAGEEEAAVLLQRDLDLRDRAELAARRNRGQPRHLRVEVVPLQRTEDHIVAAGGEAEVAVLSVLALAHEEQRDSSGQRILADGAAELRRGHVEEIEAEDDEVRPLGARFHEAFAAGQRGRHGGAAAAEDGLLEQHRPAGVIDEEDASVLAHQAAEISRSLRIDRWRSSTNVASWSAVFDLPRPMRMEPMASASGTPIAVSTRDGARSPDAHADPDESEKRRMAIISESASTRSKLTFRLPGNLNARGPFTEAPSISATMRSRNSSRNAARRAASPVISAARRRNAAARPTTPGTFTVPERTPFSCPPPTIVGSMRMPRRTSRPPMPFGP